ncbi:MAG TPA: glycerophosphodiester phosphodiesterase [Solirubrobacteraceae bacterium]|nr:glycerophosphodiester phosphodiesterase [Solirubrobacteraceae bacterium]
MHTPSAATVDVIGHRGASAYVREHTVEAFELALRQGASMLELDVRATAEGDLVAVHDATLLRTAHDPRRISRLTRADLLALDPLRRPLTLDSVLERYGRRTRLLIDLKHPTAGSEQRIISVLKRHGLAGEAIVQSFDTTALRRLRHASPSLAVAPLYRVAPTNRRLRAITSYAGGIGVWHTGIDAALVLRAHAAGIAVRAWTVNDPDEMMRLVALGVDGIITDVPDVAHAVVERAAAATPRAA